MEVKKVGAVYMHTNVPLCGIYCMSRTLIYGKVGQSAGCASKKYLFQCCNLHIKQLKISFLEVISWKFWLFPLIFTKEAISKQPNFYKMLGFKNELFRQLLCVLRITKLWKCFQWKCSTFERNILRVGKFSGWIMPFLVVFFCPENVHNPGTECRSNLEQWLIND